MRNSIYNDNKVGVKPINLRTMLTLCVYVCVCVCVLHGANNYCGLARHVARVILSVLVRAMYMACLIR